MAPNSSIKWEGDEPQFKQYPPGTTFISVVVNVEINYNRINGGINVVTILRCVGARGPDGTKLAYPSEGNDTDLPLRTALGRRRGHPFIERSSGPPIERTNVHGLCALTEPHPAHVLQDAHDRGSLSCPGVDPTPHTEDEFE